MIEGVCESSSFIESRKNDLNERQLEAVMTVQGPVLVLAGAGSGKTRVLTYRIAHLVEDYGVPLSSILSMTFSNKAAREMENRVRDLLQIESPLPWISTFHSVGARILRKYGSLIGLSPNFVIYDEDEQRGMIKGVMENLSIDPKEFQPEAIHRRIGQWKNEGRNVEAASSFRATGFDTAAHRVYESYAKEMMKAQAVDFDDLLLLTFQIFHTQPAIKEIFHRQWDYILVDEFQDTNDLQFKLLKEFLNPNQNICVVGDDDQSIYGWRGAKIDNILNFDRQFSNCKTIKLEQNYRSTSTILSAAHEVISKNEMRHEKKLWTSQGVGEKIKYSVLSDDRAEAAFIVSDIKTKITSGISANDIAVLYRMNSISRGLEEECLRQRLPYRIVGGFRFYERKEIKDILSYLRLLLNPNDRMSFQRSIANPNRGLGKSTVEKIEASAASQNIGPLTWVLQNETSPAVGKGKEGYRKYRELMQKLSSMLDASASFVDLGMDLLDQSGYVALLRSEKLPDSQDRLDNIQEFLSAVQEFEENWEPSPEVAAEVSETSATRLKLRDFLERVSLISDQDLLDSGRAGQKRQDLDQPQVTFMSIHAAKGLEFQACYLCGLEEGIFPSARSFDQYQQLEEERRLCYVALTRAKNFLTLTRAEMRRTFGMFNANIESRFLKDIPQEFFDTVYTPSESSSSRSSSAGFFDGYSPRKYGRGIQKAQDDFDQRTDDDVFSPSIQSEFSVGERVIHPSFGEGVVQGIELLGSDECLAITFKAKGRKKVLSRYVKKK